MTVPPVSNEPVYPRKVLSWSLVCLLPLQIQERLRLSRFVRHKEHLSLGWFRLSVQEWLADKSILFLPLFRETAQRLQRLLAEATPRRRTRGWNPGCFMCGFINNPMLLRIMHPRKRGAQLNNVFIGLREKKKTEWPRLPSRVEHLWEESAVRFMRTERKVNQARGKKSRRLSSWWKNISSESVDEVRPRALRDQHGWIKLFAQDGPKRFILQHDKWTWMKAKRDKQTAEPKQNKPLQVKQAQACRLC